MLIVQRGKKWFEPCHLITSGFHISDSLENKNESTRNADYANHWFTWSRSKTVKFISGRETGILRSWDQVPVFLVWILSNHKVKYLDGRQHSSEPITSTAWTDFTWLASFHSVMMKQVSTEKYLTSRFPFSLQWINTRCADKPLYSPNILGPVVRSLVSANRYFEILGPGSSLFGMDSG